MWDSIAGHLVMVDVGRDGHVWGLTENKEVFVRTGVTAKNIKGDAWQGTNGSCIDIAVCTTGHVFCIGSDEKSYFRTGITQDNYIGDNWQKLEDETFVTISCGKDGRLVGFGKNHRFYGRKDVSWTAP